MSRSRRPGDGGYILVAVLGVMLILTGFMAASSLLVRSALDAARVDDADISTLGLTRAGLELAAFELFVVKAAPAKVDGRRMRFSGGTIAPHVVDEAGKADLNESDSKLLTSVFQGAGLDDGTARGLIACIVDLRGPDRNAAGPDAAASQQQAGAQPADQTAQQPPQPQPTQPQAQPAQQPRPRGFQSVDQLRDCPDLSGEDYAAIAPLLTVYNPGGKINILTASAEMLHALPGLSAADVEVILAKRGSITDKKSVDDLMGLMKEAKDYGKTEPGPVYTVRVDATSATGRKKTIHAVVAASKSQSDPYYVLDWWD